MYPRYILVIIDRHNLFNQLHSTVPFMNKPHPAIKGLHFFLIRYRDFRGEKKVLFSFKNFCLCTLDIGFVCHNSCHVEGIT